MEIKFSDLNRGFVQLLDTLQLVKQFSLIVKISIFQLRLLRKLNACLPLPD